MTALIWSLIVYAGLKFAQLMTGGDRGYRLAPVSIADRLRRGEPWLIVLAVILVVPLSLTAHRYHQRKFAAVLERAVDCYGRLSVVSGREGVASAVHGHAFYEGIRGYRETASDAAAQLGLGQDDTARMLKGSVAALMRQAVLPPGRTTRCLAVSRDAPNT